MGKISKNKKEARTKTPKTNKAVKNSVKSLIEVLDYVTEVGPLQQQIPSINVEVPSNKFVSKKRLLRMNKAILNRGLRTSLDLLSPIKSQVSDIESDLLNIEQDVQKLKDYREMQTVSTLDLNSKLDASLSKLNASYNTTKISADLALISVDDIKDSIKKANKEIDNYRTISYISLGIAVIALLTSIFV